MWDFVIGAILTFVLSFACASLVMIIAIRRRWIKAQPQIVDAVDRGFAWLRKLWIF